MPSVWWEIALVTKRIMVSLLVTILVPISCAIGEEISDDGADLVVAPEASRAITSDYFSRVHEELQKKWPDNRSVRLVFHGHSVPAGYFRTPVVRRFDSYPMQFYKRLCEEFPTAVIDVIVTAIGGEDSERGAQRLEADVLALKPDVVFIDYSLNDRRIGLERAEAAWRKMIEASSNADVLVVLLTPTPDSREDILDIKSPLMQHALQVKRLGQEYKAPVIDSYASFKSRVANGQKVKRYLAQTNHPNREGHTVVTNLVADIFLPAKVDER